jgi:hypothetical protein
MAFVAEVQRTAPALALLDHVATEPRRRRWRIWEWSAR